MIRSYFKRADPFFDEEENHSLIGVANVFLACLFYDVKLQYAVPIINQKGEVGDQLKFALKAHNFEEHVFMAQFTFFLSPVVLFIRFGSSVVRCSGFEIVVEISLLSLLIGTKTYGNELAPIVLFLFLTFFFNIN